MLNLSSLVSRGGGEEASVWRDMTGQNGSPMGLDVLQLLSAFYVPHLVETERKREIILYLISSCCSAVSLCVCVCECEKELHLDSAVEGPGQQSCVSG